jgi:FkbM family methyltransferase
MTHPSSRLQRVTRKLRLRLKLAWQFATRFEVEQQRQTCKVTYSQCGEDMIVWFIFAILGRTCRTYLDIGAHHPIYLSNTALFSLFGARGMNIEADPVLFAEFPRQRPRDINLNVGVAETAGEMTFFRMSDPSLSTFSATEAESIARHRGVTIQSRNSVRVERIGAILQQWSFVPDFLSIDVEGQDLAILRTYDFDQHRPVVICAETLAPAPDGSDQKNTALVDFLASKGFRTYADTYINTIFVDEACLQRK